MDVTPSGIVVFLQPKIRVLDDFSIMALQLLRESYFALFASTVIDVKADPPTKPSAVNVVTF